MRLHGLAYLHFCDLSSLNCGGGGGGGGVAQSVERATPGSISAVTARSLQYNVTG